MNLRCRSLLFTKGKTKKIIGVEPTSSHVQIRQELLISLRRNIQPHKSKVLHICLVLFDDDDDDNDSDDDDDKEEGDWMLLGC